jgi:hypothetical protein
MEEVMQLRFGNRTGLAGGKARREILKILIKPRVEIAKFETQY